MTPALPIQFLVGVTRLIAIYFGLRSLDSIGGTVMYYAIQKSAAPELVRGSPSVWTFFLPVLALYFALVILVWFAAPFICRLAVGSPAAAQPETGQEPSWNEVMIFLVGTLFVGWGLTRLADALVPILQSQVRNLHHELNYADELQFFMTTALMGLGGVMMARFPSIYRWMQRKKLQ